MTDCRPPDTPFTLLTPPTDSEQVQRTLQGSAGTIAGMARSINLIVVHCSATANGDSLFRGRPGEPGFQTPADQINGWHKQRGFQRTHPDSKFWNPKLTAIGYHFVLACNGTTFTGRSLDEPGAHAQGFNRDSIGICLTGTNAYTAEQWEKLAYLLRQLTTNFGIPLSPPRRVKSDKHPLGYQVVDGVCGHRDLSPDGDGDGLIEPFEWLKTCPGFSVADYIKSGLTPPSQHVCTGV